VALVRNDVSDERIAFIIRVKRISELGTTLAVATEAEDGLLHSHRREILESYKFYQDSDLSGQGSLLGTCLAGIPMTLALNIKKCPECQPASNTAFLKMALELT
jgi:hypothetical protein